MAKKKKKQKKKAQPKLIDDIDDFLAQGDKELHKALNGDVL